jgi:ATP-dependent helicase/nuclease subunit A
MASSGNPIATRAAQHQASNPNHSAWVSANAGSGKTHVLANRVIRLLLHGADPSKILCLTFTKAAAANMAGRVFTTLAQWTQLADAELAAEIEESGAPRPDEAGLACARKLFARAAETPGGLKIQTIHAFCERLLHLFPFEANVPASFEVPDELAQQQLLQRAQRDVLAKASLDKGALGKALQRLSDECGPAGFSGLVKETMRLNALARTYSMKDPEEVLRRSLGLGGNRDVGAIEREIIEGGISPEHWSGIADTLELGTSNDKDTVAKFRQALRDYQLASSGGQLGAVISSYLDIYFTKDGGVRKRLMANGLARANPKIESMLRDEQARLEGLRAERKAAATVERTRALMTIAAAVSKRYADEKAARGILDFDDLISKTSTLLQHSDARWVLYKLDAGIDHILVDEAQDTSESQWRILADLTSEFSAGEGAGPASRTFFAVGDEKQSIFSFQGAAPKMFGKMGKELERQFTAAAKPFLRVPLTSSFRSVPAILYAVDKIFDFPGHNSGLTDGEWMKHESLKGTLPGIVELWPVVSTPATEDFGGWTLPDEFPDAKDPANSVALRVAQKIALLLKAGSKEIVHETGTHQPRAVRARDILILVRKRGPFFEAMIRALKKSAIPVAGADRLDLTDHIAVKDLIAAGRAALLPQDDLTLACVLKSPFIGLDDNDLLQLAPTRTGSLFDALDSSLNSKHTAAAAKLARWQARAGGGAFAFYSALLCAEGGRRAIEARLGLEACDAIDEFLRLAIAHDENGAPSLAAFLHGLEGIEYSIKRDMETSADMVRVMTVHAAKGLEAKIVFLPDACDVPSPRHLPVVFSLAADVPGEDAIAWSPRKDLDCEKIAAAREEAGSAARDEYRRLLYVALTRAEERLYIAGFHGTKDPDSGCWYKMIEAALGSGAGFEEVPAFWDSAEKIRRFASPASGAPAVDRAPGAEAGAQPLPPPDWLFRAAHIEQSTAAAMAPSHALVAANGETQPRRQALQRGRAMHLLLQYLPLLAPEKRETAAAAFLAARAPFLDETARLKLAQEALALLALPELAPLFGPRSRAEVLVAGKVTAGQRTFDVAGQVDRIGETEHEIFVADYKTGAPCPLERTPAAYLVQMALYRAVLAPLWPKKHLAMALIWTASPAAVWVPGALLDAALESLVAR